MKQNKQTKSVVKLIQNKFSKQFSIRKEADWLEKGEVGWMKAGVCLAREEAGQRLSAFFYFLT